MIQLTRLNEQPLTVNSDLIKFVESMPDTVVTLVSGEKIVVRERVDQVIEKVIQFRRAVLTGLPMMTAAGPALSSGPADQTAPRERKEGVSRG